jgi:hypothetical protein|tara:strand:+ start:2879 stop:3073 length:195 start_codon:yes stop_codon:yes gene_type:complete
MAKKFEVPATPSPSCKVGDKVLYQSGDTEYMGFVVSTEGGKVCLNLLTPGGLSLVADAKEFKSA